MSPRVLLADDHELVRQGLKALLEREGMQVIAEASDGREALRLVRELNPDIAVLDLGGLGRKAVCDIIAGCRQFQTRFVILAPDGTTEGELTEYRDAGYAVVDELDSATLLETIRTDSRYAEGAK